MPAETLFVGLGSHHGDDRAGWMVTDELRSTAGTGFDVRNAMSPIDLLDWLGGVTRLGVCDACRGAGAVGTWRRWLWPQSDLLLVRSRNSHDMGLVAVLQLAQLLGTLPQQVFVWGIELASNEAGGAISAEVAAAIPSVALDVANILGAPRSAGDPALSVSGDDRACTKLR